MKGEWEPFFKHWGGARVDHLGKFVTVEEFYQVIKERLKDELVSDTHGTSNYGLLRDRPDAAPLPSSQEKP